MAKPPQAEPNEFTPEETARRRDEALKRALSMPPKPFTPKAKTRPASKGRVHKGKSGR